MQGRDLSDEVVIYREDPDAVATDADGVVTPTTSTIWTGPGFVSSARPRRNETIGGDRIAEADHRIRLPLDEAIVAPGDTIQVIKSDNVDLVGQIFDVIAAIETSTRVTRQVWCKRRQADTQR